MTGEHFSPDIQAFLRLLDAHRVRYLIVGEEAVIHHGYPRLTGDIDLFFEQSENNVRRLYRALTEFWGGPVPSLDSADDLLSPGVVVQFGRPPNRLDLLSTLPGAQFGVAWRRRVTETLAPSRGRPFAIHYIGLADLIAAKRKAARHKDLDDVEHLRPLLSRGRRKR